jgi:protein-L-isoaspartate(D-aspartate) O-methyltransferase
MQDLLIETARVPDALSDSVFFRRNMIECQVRTFDVTDRALLARMLDVPREDFLPPELKPFAYSDTSLQIKSSALGQRPRTLLPPLILARLIQNAHVEASDRVLDVAAGGGYSTALFAGLAGFVVALECDPQLFDLTRANLDRFGLLSVPTRLGPLADGAASDGPFDVIFVNGAVEGDLDALFAQLKDGGRLLTIHFRPDDPTERAGKAVRFDKIGGAISSRNLFDASTPVLEAFRKTASFAF